MPHRTDERWSRRYPDGMRGHAAKLEDGFAWTLARGTRVVHAGGRLQTLDEATMACEDAWKLCSLLRASHGPASLSAAES